MKSKLINVIGLGYIGLPTAATLAVSGYNVLGTDISHYAVTEINKGKAHIFEPDLDDCVRSAVVSGHLKTSTLYQAADIYIICVPTPICEVNGVFVPDVKSVIDAAKGIGKYVKSGDLVILESTCPVGTTEQIKAVLQDAGVPVDQVHIAYCPERVLPGKIMIELVENDRIIGGLTTNATSAVADFYRTFVSGAVLETNAKVAELCKLAENSFRDVNIAFANELSLICNKEGINVWELIQLANRHPRVNILQPGPGVGGHCIAVDPWFIIARDFENSKLIRTAREVNNQKTDWVIDKIKTVAVDKLSKTGKKPKIAFFGLSFKPNVDDLRESPAVNIVLSLDAAGYQVLAVEPNIISHASIKIVSLEEAFSQADVFAILVQHRQFDNSIVKQRLLDCEALDFCGALFKC